VTPEEFIIAATKLVSDLDAQCFLAATTIQGEQSERIFEEGQDSFGANLPNYSIKRAYIKDPKSKARSRFYEGGYAEYKKFRQSKAAQSGRWDLVQTNELQFEFLTKPERTSECNYTVEIKGAAAERAFTLEQKANTIIFQPTDKEVDKWQNLLIESVDNIINEFTK
jgi:hypothetical protein